MKNAVKFLKEDHVLLGAVTGLLGLLIVEGGKCSRTCSQEKTKRLEKERECDMVNRRTDTMRFTTEQYNATQRHDVDRKNERQQRRLDFLDKQFQRGEKVLGNFLRR